MTQLALPDFEALPLPAPVQQHPGMITRAERALLYWLARAHFRGRGMIVDAGVFLGASTVAFAAGLRENGRIGPLPAPPIQSYDIARWVASMDRYLDRPETRAAFAGSPPAAGESFAPALRRLIAPHAALVDLHVGNIVELARGSGPVEIAFYDCLKTNERDLAVFRAFAPHYQPGHTIVLQQDYFYESAACNKIRQEYFADHFEYLGQVSTTAVFRFTRAIPAALIADNPVARLSVAQKLRLLRRAAARAGTDKTRVLTGLAGAEFLIEAGAARHAAEELARLDAEIARLGPSRLTRRPEQVSAGLHRRLAALSPSRAP